MIVRQVLLGLAGLGVSCYAYYIKKQLKKDPQYKALCDLGANASCSRVLTSKYGHGFGIAGYLFGENSALNISIVKLGMGFYAFQILSGFTSQPFVNRLALASSLVACSGSIYLAGVLVFVLKDFCLLCVTMYLINAGLLWSSMRTI